MKHPRRLGHSKKEGSLSTEMRRAQERLRQLVHPALDRLEKAIRDDENPTQALIAARDVLGRVPAEVFAKEELRQLRKCLRAFTRRVIQEDANDWSHQG